MKLKKEEQALKKKYKAVIATKVAKAKPHTKVAEKLKETQRIFAEKRKRRYFVQLYKVMNQRSPRGRGRLLESCTVRSCPLL